MLADLLHLSRNLRRSPASAGAAILTLSLTLGAGTSIFAVVHAVLLTPLPFHDPDALVTVGEVPIDQPAAGPRRATFATIENWRERAESLAALEAIEGTNLTLTELGDAERVNAVDVTPGFFTLLGVTPVLGRAFGVEDVGRQIVLLSHDFWRGRFASDPRVLGRPIVLGGQSHTIVGVLPERLREFDPSEVWRPLQLMPGQAEATEYRMSVVARLAPNAPPATLAAALDGVSRNSSSPSRVVVTPLAASIAGDATRTLGLLAAVAGLAAIIAFTNLAGLLIVRSIDRRRELAIRNALGARQSETARQLLLEAQTLVALGIVGGVLLALWMTPFVGHLALQQFGGLRHREVAISWQVVAIVAVAAWACACVCALLPAFNAAQRSAVDILRRGTTPASREINLRRVFVTAQVALAFVLLVSVTLLSRNLVGLLNVNPGFDARGVLILKTSLPPANYENEKVVSFYSALQRALQERIGPRSTAIVSEIPLDGSLRRSVLGVRPGDLQAEAVVREAGPAYFDVMRIPIVAGRSFEFRDDASAPRRAVISESLAEQLFASEQPIGRQIWLQEPQMAEVIGVVGDVKHGRLDEAFLPTLYLPASQVPSRSSVIVVRSGRPEADVIATVREEVALLDRDLPVYGGRSMDDVVAGSRGVPESRLLTAAFMGFALLALVLGATGLFGVVAHDVASRRTEFAVRIALGAEPLRILRGVFTQGALMMASGLAVGSLLSVWTAGVLSSVGFAASGLDAVSVSVAAGILVISGAAAVFPAARRAARTDPLTALRSE